MDDHEAAVAAFFAQCEAERPAETAEVYARHKVLAESTLENRRRREVSTDSYIRVGRGRFAPLADVLTDEREPHVEPDWEPEPVQPFKTTAEKQRDALRDFLADGPKPAAEVAKLMPDYSLRKAKAELGVTTRRVGFGRSSIVVWELAHTR